MTKLKLNLNRLIRSVIPPKTIEINLHEELAKQYEIAVIWNFEDVQSVRPDLARAEAWKVLQAAKRYHDATIGINWETLECHADIIYPMTEEK